MSGDGLADQVGEWISNGQQVVGMLGAAGQQVASARQASREEKAPEKKLRLKLGEWANTAHRHGRWHQPVLSLESFEEHRDERALKGYFTPSGTCRSGFGWAHLLFALDIRPGAILPKSKREIIGWRMPVGDEDPVDTGDIHLELAPEVLCHVINIYRLYSVSDPRTLEESKQEKPWYQLPFGVLSVTEYINKKLELKFEPQMSITNPATTAPFRTHPYSPGGRDKLCFTDNKAITAYLLAINSGISQTDLVLTNPSYPTDRLRELVERTKELVVRLDALRGFPWSNPYLLTPDWLEKASKIYRRITTNTSAYPYLQRDIILAMQNKDAIINFIQDRFDTAAKWEDPVKKIIRGRLLFAGENIQHVWGIGLSSSIDELLLSQLLEGEMSSIIASFVNKPKGSLPYILSTIPHEACFLLAKSAGPEIRDAPGVVLEFTPTHKLWGCYSIVR